VKALTCSDVNLILDFPSYIKLYISNHELRIKNLLKVSNFLHDSSGKIDFIVEKIVKPVIVWRGIFGYALNLKVKTHEDVI